VLKERRKGARRSRSSKDAIREMAEKPSHTLMYFPPSTYSSRYGDDFFTVKIVGYRVKGAEEGDVDPLGDCLGLFAIPKGHAVYGIEVHRGSRDAWTVWRRFSEFIELGASLQDALVGGKGGQDLPPFDAKPPPKTLFPRLDDDFLSERQQLLDEYLDALCTMGSRHRPKQGGVLGTPIVHFCALED
jgi:hypothetical protein